LLREKPSPWNWGGPSSSGKRAPPGGRPSRTRLGENEVHKEKKSSVAAKKASGGRKQITLSNNGTSLRGGKGNSFFRGKTIDGGGKRGTVLSVMGKETSPRVEGETEKGFSYCGREDPAFGREKKKEKRKLPPRFKRGGENVPHTRKRKKTTSTGQ